MGRLRWYWDEGCHCDQPVVTSATRLGNRCIRCGRDRDPLIMNMSQWRNYEEAKARAAAAKAARLSVARPKEDT